MEYPYYKKQTPPTSGEFQDDLFPPNADSLFARQNGNYKDKDMDRVRDSWNGFVKESEVEWKRAKEIYGENCKIFADEVTVDDISQGTLGDCYFVSAISALAEFPKFILQLFKTKTMPANHCVEVYMRMDGEWRTVCLDDYFPCDKSTGKPIFAAAADKELWPLFLEKAWAKINGGYLNIVGGLERDAFSALTPFTTYTLNTMDEDQNELWNNIKMADECKCIMTCGTDVDVSESAGFIPGHSYSLISAFEREFQGSTVKLIKLRNPWAQQEWKGLWSDKSDSWTAEAKKVFPEYNEHSGNDGVFWIDFDNFWNYLHIVTFCNPVNNIQTYSFLHNKKQLDGYKMLRVSVPEECVFTAEISVKTFRYHRVIQNDEEVIANIILARVNKDNGTLDYVDSCSNEGLIEKIEKGDYLVYYNVDYQNGSYRMKRKFTLTIGADTDLKFKKQEEDVNFNVLTNIMKPQIMKNQKYLDKKSQDLIFMTFLAFEKTHIGCIYMENINSDFAYIAPRFNFRNLAELNSELPKTVIHVPKGKTYMRLIAPRTLSSMSCSCGASFKNMTEEECIENCIDSDSIGKALQDVNYNDHQKSFQYSC